MKKLLLAALFCALSTNAWGAFSDLDVWVADSLTKYRQDGEDGTSGSSSIAIAMMKNEFESVQVLIYNDTGSAEDIEDVEVTGDAITNNHLDVWIYEQRYYSVASGEGSRCDYPYGAIPDALIPKIDMVWGETRNGDDGFLRSGGSVYSLPDSKLKGIWIDIGSNASTPAGDYTLTVAVQQSGETDIECTITVTVWNITCPSTPTYPSILAYDRSGWDTGFGQNVDDEDYTKIMAELLMMHQQSIYLAGHPEIISYDASGNVTSWTGFEDAYESAIDGTLISSGTKSGAKLLLGFRPTVTLAGNDTHNRNAIEDWWSKWSSEGWDSDRLYYVTTPDEPAVQSAFISVRTQADAAYDNMSNNIRAFVTGRRRSELYTTDSPYDSVESLDDRGIYVTNGRRLSYRVEIDGVNGMKSARSTYPSQDQVWLYITDNNHGGAEEGYDAEDYGTGLDIMVDAPAMFTRLLGFMLYAYEVSGFLYYDINLNAYWDDPFADQWNQGGHGEGILTYPGVVSTSGLSCGAGTPSIGGTNDTLLPSIRLKLLRDAIEDWELFALAEAATSRNTVLTYVNNMFDELEGSTCARTPTGCSNEITGEGPWYCSDYDNTNDLDSQRASIAALMVGGVNLSDGGGTVVSSPGVGSIVLQ